jgi:hypothetical protein
MPPCSHQRSVLLRAPRSRRATRTQSGRSRWWLECSRTATNMQCPCGLARRRRFIGCILSFTSFALFKMFIMCAAPAKFWCVLPFRLVLLSGFHALAGKRYEGPRDTTPGLCRCCTASLPDTALAATVSPGGVLPSLSHYPDSRVAPGRRAGRRSLRRAGDEPRCTVQTM